MTIVPKKESRNGRLMAYPTPQMATHTRSKQNVVEEIEKVHFFLHLFFGGRLKKQMAVMNTN